MPHNDDSINRNILLLADEFKVKPIVTPDCHHVDPSQKEVQEFKLLMNTHGKFVKDATYEKSKKKGSMMERLDYLYGEDRQITFNKFDIHLLSYEEIKAAMESQGIDRPDIYSNTLLLAETVGDYGIQEGLNLLPVQYKSPDKELAKVALEGLVERGLSENQEYLDRLEEELQIIKDKKFAPYFLVVSNMINWAKKEEIMVGPGRGSSAGSLVCYALKITDIDPIEHNLLFFRFINPERNDFPDIDTDIQDTRREEVKDYLVRQYRHVASIATFLQLLEMFQECSTFLYQMSIKY
jgi:DNA polymerase-3 subunit alpha